MMTSAAVAQPADVSQPFISGNAPASALGSPFGQSFVPTSLQSLIGIGLAVVNDIGVGDISISLYHASADGGTLLGGPITSGTITAAQISSYYVPVTTPLWFPVFFDQPYAQSPGEHLAFTITGGGSLDFYYSNASGYFNGRLLGNSSLDLTFATLVPEPGTASLFLMGCIGLRWRFINAMKRKLVRSSSSAG